MEESLQECLGRFEALGGVAENVCQREGDFGRGMFPVDASRSAKIMAPKNLLVDSGNLGICGGEIMIKDKARYTAQEAAFLGDYYNNYSWGNNGNSDSASFLKFIASLSSTIKKQLLVNGFVDRKLLGYCDDSDHLLKRFIDERVVEFHGRNVLAPVWEFVNHSSFVPPLRVTPHGVETPPMERGSGEILFKYSAKNSPMGMWRKYGFACSCVVAYSIPFEMTVDNQPLSVSCSGQLGSDSKDGKNFSVVGNRLLIKSLPVGCLSVGLPFSNFSSILASVGLSQATANKLFSRILEANIKARCDLIGLFQGPGLGAQAQLHKALSYEISLIESSSLD